MLKNFRLGIIIRVLFLCASIALCLFLIFDATYYVTIGLLVVLIIFQTLWLIRYVEQTNHKLSRFFNSIQYSDFSRSFTSHQLGTSFRELDKTFASVVDAFKKQRIEKQVQFRYMQTVVQHIGIGLVSFNPEGEVELINTAAKRIFQIPTLRNIEDLKTISPAMVMSIKQMQSGSRQVVRISINDRSLQLAVHATAFRMQDEMYKLVSFQDINAELEEKEMDAWQNLTQVLAHEIMNSVTPIASLSDTVQMLLKEYTQKQGDQYIINKEAIKDVSEALETIQTRSQGLIHFVNSYRDFTKIPKPEVELFSVDMLLRRVRNLNAGEAKLHGITINTTVDPKTLEISADPHLVEQVLINLIKNAFRALEHNKGDTITLSAEIASGGGIYIHVHDNGGGINPENIDKIFIPFYSTRRPFKGSGSGIGLSLSRQIMRAHGGTLSVKSNPQEGTTFTLQF